MLNLHIILFVNLFFGYFFLLINSFLVSVKNLTDEFIFISSYCVFSKSLHNYLCKLYTYQYSMLNWVFFYNPTKLKSFGMWFVVTQMVKTFGNIL